MLPSTFDLADVERFLKQRDTEDNVRKCMRKIRRLVTGQGVSHEHRSDVFMRGVPVVPSDDLKELRMRANKWLPYTRAKGRADRSGGWALTHPIAKLQLYKKEVLLSRPLPPLLPPSVPHSSSPSVPPLLPLPSPLPPLR